VLTRKHQHPGASSSASTAEAAAEAAAKAPDPDAAVAAAIAAAEAAGRACSPQDLHAAWLMQRLEAGLMRVVVQPPLVSTAALQQALADHGVDVIPGGLWFGLVCLLSQGVLRSGRKTAAACLIMNTYA
jgi:hypothetical protein